MTKQLNDNPKNPFQIIHAENESLLYLRQIDERFKTIEALDEFFVANVVGFSKSPSDIYNCEQLANKYFTSVEGIWFVKQPDPNSYLQIIPSRIANSRKVKEYLTELLVRNEGDIIDILEKEWPEDNTYLYNTPVSWDEIYLDEKEDDDIRRNITG